jgi:hypothetical protein
MHISKKATSPRTYNFLRNAFAPDESQRYLRSCFAPSSTGDSYGPKQVICPGTIRFSEEIKIQKTKGIIIRRFKNKEVKI